MADTHAWRVLLVDDEPDSLRLAHDILEMTGAEVHCAANAEEFGALWRTTTPDLVIVDLSMPKPDGWDMLATIQHDMPEHPPHVIAITAYYSDLVSARARQVGFDALVHKPLRYNELIGVVRRVMGAA